MTDVFEALGEEYDAIWARTYTPPGWHMASVFWYRPAYTLIEELVASDNGERPIDQGA